MDALLDLEEAEIGEALATIRISAVASSPEVHDILDRLPASDGFQVSLIEHGMDFISNAHDLVVFEVRLLSAFDDLDLIRKFRVNRPLQPLVAVTSNDDEEFIAEIYKSGATVLHIATAPAIMLVHHLKSLARMSEASRLLEIQNAEMVRSMNAERAATEARLKADAAKEIAEKTKEILDNLPEAFLIVEKDLSIPVGSASCQQIFGSNVADGKIGSLLNLKDGQELYLQNVLEQVFEDFMPTEVNMGLLPKILHTADGRTLEAVYTLVKNAAGSPEKVIMSALDISAHLREKEEAEKRLRLFQTLVRFAGDRAILSDFVQDTKRTLLMLRETSNMDELKRILHTLKGNTAVMGFENLAERIHGLENDLEESPVDMATFRIAAAGLIEMEMKAFLTQHGSVLQVDWDHPASLHVLKDAELRFLRAFIQHVRSAHTEKALQLLDRISYRSVASMLPDFASIAQVLGEKLGKSLRIELRGGKLRLDPKRFDPLLKTLIHAIRNACDHGIETPEGRENLGKPTEGYISVRFGKTDDGSLQIAIMDDGAGISTKKLLAKAVSKGLITAADAKTMKRQDVLQLVFHEGLSTAESVSDISGRGVGMACIKEEVERLGGNIRISSNENVGTRCEIRIPSVFKIKE